MIEIPDCESRGRRAWLARIAGTAVCLLSSPLTAHTPYGQWKAYRQKHLTIGCHRDDPATYRLAKRIVAELGIELPEASARVARGPTAGRIASLLGTGQMEVTVLSVADAVAMTAGAGAFEAYGSIALRQILQVDDDHLLVCVADMPERHVRLVAEALLGSTMTLDIRSDPPAGIRRHAGIDAMIDV